MGPPVPSVSLHSCGRQLASRGPQEWALITTSGTPSPQRVPIHLWHHGTPGFHSAAKFLNPQVISPQYMIRLKKIRLFLFFLFTVLCPWKGAAHYPGGREGHIFSVFKFSESINIFQFFWSPIKGWPFSPNFATKPTTFPAIFIRSGGTNVPLASAKKMRHISPTSLMMTIFLLHSFSSFCFKGLKISLDSKFFLKPPHPRDNSEHFHHMQQHNSFCLSFFVLNRRFSKLRPTLLHILTWPKQA